MPVKLETLVIGTRGSPLALWQAEKVRSELALIGQKSKIKTIKTTGDWSPHTGEVSLSSKACFATEIETALLNGEIDLGVHSMKDMEVDLPDGLSIPFMLPRADVRDAFLSRAAKNLGELPIGAIVGTVSPRRAAFALHMRADLKIVPFRGNVQTRIDKMISGQVDATFLAVAGLDRLRMNSQITSVVDLEYMLPSVGQGAVGIEIRQADRERFSFMESFSCEHTRLCVETERGVLRALSGSCHTPVGVLAELNDFKMRLRVKVLSQDGSQVWSANESASVGSILEAVEFGEAVGCTLKRIVPEGVLSESV